MKPPRTDLIFIPTYDESKNVEMLCSQILALDLEADILFLDDNSPDGTGDILDKMAAEHPGVFVLHRSGKLGIGSAHQRGIEWAYSKGYLRLVTMDCDFTHRPQDIPSLLELADEADVVVGSRWLSKDSLPGWNLFRRGMTCLGHALTRGVLGIQGDASGAFRVYRLDRVPASIFRLVHSSSYAFFFESLFILQRSGFSVSEVPIMLPARTYGSSKLNMTEASRSAAYLLKLSARPWLDPESMRIPPPPPVATESGWHDPQGWDSYWDQKSHSANRVYALVAELYRKTFIRPRLQEILRKHFPAPSSLLHAGCGGGQVDMGLPRRLQITALDISPVALRLYQRHNPLASKVCHGSVFRLPFEDANFDGIYNLGVMEHFLQGEIQAILKEFSRVLKPGGKVVLFWPHAHATSVYFLNACHFILNRCLRRAVRLHPPEVSLLRSRGEAETTLNLAGFRLVSYDFGARDFWVQAALVAERE